MIEVTLCPNVYDWDWYKRLELRDWGDVKQYFSQWRVVPRKDARELIGPYELKPDAPNRRLVSIKSVTLAMFDVDKMPDGSPVTGPEVMALGQRLFVAGMAHILYSTYSGPPAHRLVMPVSDPIAPRLWKQARSNIASRWGIPVVSSESSDASHAFYLPSHRAGEPYLYLAHDGAPIDTNQWAGASNSSIPDGVDPEALFPETTPGGFDEAWTRRELRAIARVTERTDPEAAGYLRSCADGEPLGDSARNPKTARLCWLLVHHLHPLALEDYWALLKPSVRRMQQDGSSLKDTEVDRMLRSAARKWNEWQQMKTLSTTKILSSDSASS